MDAGDFIPRRPIYLYDIPSPLLESLGKPIGRYVEPRISPKIAGAAEEKTLTTVVPASRTCGLCMQHFESDDVQRSHFRSDWHRYNIKQKLKSGRAVTEDEFEALLEDLDESLSGSDSNHGEESLDGEVESSGISRLLAMSTLTGQTTMGRDEDHQPASEAKSPLAWLRSDVLPANHYIGIYTAILTAEDLESPSLGEAVRRKQLQPLPAPKSPGKPDTMHTPILLRQPHIFLCMAGGGHFAAMVVSLLSCPLSQDRPIDRQALVIAHKTFHKYTTRRKQGGAQSTNDNAKGKANSVGAQIRRANEQALITDVGHLLSEWKSMIGSSQLLFVRATGIHNRKMVFGAGDGDHPIKAKDPRLRRFPFSTRRATQRELMRAFVELTRLKIRKMAPAVDIQPDSLQTEPVLTPPTAVPKDTEGDDELKTAMLHSSQLQSMIRRRKLPALLSYLRENQLSGDFSFQPVDSQANRQAPTPLHMAASQGARVVVLGLMVEANADPTIVNSWGKTPFELSVDRATRDVFRLARGEIGEARWNWTAAKIPDAISKAEADKRATLELGREALRKADAEQQVDSPVGPVHGTPGLMNKLKGRSWEEEIKGMTPEMKAKLQREQRARAAEERLRKSHKGVDPSCRR